MERVSPCRRRTKLRGWHYGGRGFRQPWISSFLGSAGIRRGDDAEKKCLSSRNAADKTRGTGRQGWRRKQEWTEEQEKQGGEEEEE